MIGKNSMAVNMKGYLIQVMGLELIKYSRLSHREMQRLPAKRFSGKVIDKVFLAFPFPI